MATPITLAACMPAFAALTVSKSEDALSEGKEYVTLGRVSQKRISEDTFNPILPGLFGM